MENDPQRNWLAQRISAIQTHHVKNVIIPEELRQTISSKFFEAHKNVIPRHMRDFGRLLGLIKGHALLNVWERRRIEDNVIVTEDDIIEGFRLYNEISIANELGLPPEVYNIYDKLRNYIPPEVGATKTELASLYYRVFHRTIGKKRLEETLNLIMSTGLLVEEEDPSDCRRKRYLPTGQGIFSFGVESDGSNSQIEPRKLNTPQPVCNTPLTFDDLKTVHWKEGDFDKKLCCVCGHERETSWIAETFRDEEKPLCEDCFRAYQKKKDEG